jgi:hypothetical protein
VKISYTHDVLVAHRLSSVWAPSPRIGKPKCLERDGLSIEFTRIALNCSNHFRVHGCVSQFPRACRTCPQDSDRPQAIFIITYFLRVPRVPNETYPTLTAKQNGLHTRCSKSAMILPVIRL